MDFDWNATARRFLDEAADKLDLPKNVVAAYSTKVTEFYAWMFKRLEEIHADDVAAVNAKQAGVRTEMGKLVPGESGVRSDDRSADPGAARSSSSWPSWIQRAGRSCVDSTPRPEERASALLDAVGGILATAW